MGARQAESVLEPAEHLQQKCQRWRRRKIKPEMEKSRIDLFEMKNSDSFLKTFALM